MNQPYQQPERFALMQYQCGQCGHLEHLWNSRNAVTPFAIGCGLEGCDGLKQHINWPQDRRWHNLPPMASRVFVSITPSDACRIAEQKWERFAKQGVAPQTSGTREEVLADWAEHIYGDGNQPHAVSRSEYLRRQAKGDDHA